MSHVLRFPNLSLGDLERAVLECLWAEGARTPNEVHAAIGESRGISVNTVSSALKRLFEKELLHREKVSHSYTYSAAVTREELQRQLIGALSTQFEEEDGYSFISAFVDLAAARGVPMLRRLESLIAERLDDEGDE